MFSLAERTIIMKVIKLVFKSTLTGLAGYTYGKTVYEEQVKEKIDFEEGTCIEIPDHIVRIASSFIQGFFEEIVKKVGLSPIGEKIDIRCNSEELRKEILENL